MVSVAPEAPPVPVVPAPFVVDVSISDPALDLLFESPQDTRHTAISAVKNVFFIILILSTR